jgi:hypothetical protein
VESASAVLDARIRELKDWRGKTLAKVREIIRGADPEIVEEWKWVKPTSPGTPVFSHGGIVCTAETYKDHVKMTFAKGAALRDPSGLFNSSLEGNAGAPSTSTKATRLTTPRCGISSALLWRSISTATADRSPGRSPGEPTASAAASVLAGPSPICSIAKRAPTPGKPFCKSVICR